MLVALFGASVGKASALTQADASQQAARKARAVGAVKTVTGNSITLQTDAGSEMTVVIQPTTRLVRMEPGQTDLKNAPAIPLGDVQVGDRMLAGGVASDDGKSLVATTAIVMKKADVAEKQQQDREAWQKNGVGGVVKAIDAAAGTITLSTGTLASNTMTVHVSRETVIRRYAPNSVKFDDASPGTQEQIKPGDQLRARGTKSEDGKELTAAEIVSGTFRSIPATLISSDAASNSITVTDLITKRPVTLKVGPNSQMHQLPAMFAQRIAMRLKGGATGSGESSAAGNATAATRSQGAETTQGGGHGQRAGGPPDFQQMLNRMPSVSLGDLQKGSALMIVATEGTADSPSEVIILLSGVEPILTAASPRDASAILSPWNLSAGANAGTGDAP
jgi:Cu/Ag efflux protein CusF